MRLDSKLAALFVLMAAAVGLLVQVPSSYAGPAATDMLARLNGTAERVGVLVSADGGVVTATITPGEPYAVECPDVYAHVGVASTCSANPGSSSYCQKVGPAPDRLYTVARSSTLAMVPVAMPADGGTAQCPYFRMRL